VQELLKPCPEFQDAFRRLRQLLLPNQSSDREQHLHEGRAAQLGSERRRWREHRHHERLRIALELGAKRLKLREHTVDGSSEVGRGDFLDAADRPLERSDDRRRIRK